MRRFGWIITIPLAALAVVFAVNNNGPSEIDLWPLPFQVELPLFALGFAGVLIGYFVGAVSAWVSGRRWRRLARTEARDIAVLKRSLAAREEPTRDSPKNKRSGALVASGSNQHSGHPGGRPAGSPGDLPDTR